MVKILFALRAVSNEELSREPAPPCFLKIITMLMNLQKDIPLFSVSRLNHYPQSDLIRKRDRISKIIRSIVSHSKRLKLQTEIDTINLILQS